MSPRLLVALFLTLAVHTISMRVKRTSSKAQSEQSQWPQSPWQGVNSGMVGTETIHLVGHAGELYAATGNWMDSNSFARPQILRLSSPNARWTADLSLDFNHIRNRVTLLKELTFTTDSNGNSLGNPVSLLVAAAATNSRRTRVWVRDDRTKRWHMHTLFNGRYSGSVDPRTVSMHKDTVTGVDMAFLTAGEVGIYSGVYDARAPGKIRWSTSPEFPRTGRLSTRPLSSTVANGLLYFSSGSFIYRRNDGPNPTYTEVVDMNINGGKVHAGVGGVRGLTTIESPSHGSESLLFVWTIIGDPGREGCVFRLDFSSTGDHTLVKEQCTYPLMETYLGIGNGGIPYGLAGYNSMDAFEDPDTGKTVNLVGLYGRLSRSAENQVPTAVGDGGRNRFYRGAMYAVRHGPDDYRVAEVGGALGQNDPALQATRTYTLSPFAGEDAVYFGGYDCASSAARNSAWVYRAPLSTVLHSAIDGQRP